jgi:two-component system response regulator AtoC
MAVSTILIVDDDARMREVLARWLEAAGYETRQAPDAETALDLLKAGGHDVALCDVAMPGKGGLWLVERAREECPDVAMVLATGVSNIHPSISLGGNVVDYLIKPFERATVLTAVGLARAWHDAAVKAPRGGAAENELATWLRTGRTQRPEG